MDLRSFACWDCEFEYPPMACMSVVSVACFQLEVSADYSTREVLSTVVCLPEYYFEVSRVRRLWPTSVCRAMEKIVVR